jgi:hypothetical protein
VQVTQRPRLEPASQQLLDTIGIEIATGDGRGVQGGDEPPLACPTLIAGTHEIGGDVRR